MIQKVSASDYNIPTNTCPNESEKAALLLNICNTEIKAASDFSQLSIRMILQTYVKQ